MEVSALKRRSLSARWSDGSASWMRKNSMKSPLILFFTRDGDFAMAHVPSGVLEDLPHAQWPRNRRV